MQVPRFASLGWRIAEDRKVRFGKGLGRFPIKRKPWELHRRERTEPSNTYEATARQFLPAYCRDRGVPGVRPSPSNQATEAQFADAGPEAESGRSKGAETAQIREGRETLLPRLSDRS